MDIAVLIHELCDQTTRMSIHVTSSVKLISNNYANGLTKGEREQASKSRGI